MPRAEEGSEARGGHPRGGLQSPLPRRSSVNTSRARGRRKGRPKPCDPCRDKHLKCQDTSPVCSRCERTGTACTRSGSSTAVKFRPGSKQKYDTKGFSDSQTWLASNKASALQYVDETARLAKRYPREGTDGSSSLDQTSAPLPAGEEADITIESGLGDYDSSTAPNQCPRFHTTDDKSVVANENNHERILEDLRNTRKLGHSHSNSAPEFGNLPPDTDVYGLVSPRPPIDVNGWAATAGTESWGPPPSITYSSPAQLRASLLEPEQPIVAGLLKSPSESSQIGFSALEVVLLRYFINTLARWFDLCDSRKHFELVVPNRARWCAPLRNAVLATAARHLTLVQNSQNKTTRANKTYFVEGRPILELTGETALYYHNECITDLLQRSMNPEETRNEDLLAAAIILRFYEEIDSTLRDEDKDSELFLRVMNIFIDAQIYNAPLFPHVTATGHDTNAMTIDRFSGHAILPSPENIPSPVANHGTPRSQTGTNAEDFSSQWRAEGLCQAGFWVAFRQEIHSAFLKQRPFNLIISRSDTFGSFTSADDTVWADRLVNFCAEALEFCYGSTKVAAISSGLPAKERWLSLKQYEKKLSEVLPETFEPIYWREPDATKGEVFPEICFLADCHVAGIQHVELARILLAVYDPTRPKLGPGHVASRRALNQELKRIVLRLCGIALGNRKAPPGLVTASLGIAMCGDYFEHRQEQEALMGILDTLEGEHAWPVGDTKAALRLAWGWDGGDVPGTFSTVEAFT